MVRTQRCQKLLDHRSRTLFNGTLTVVAFESIASRQTVLEASSHYDLVSVQFSSHKQRTGALNPLPPRQVPQEPQMQFLQRYLTSSSHYDLH